MYTIAVMRIYFSGIGGVGIGPLAQIAIDAGYDVVGSDREASLMTSELAARGIAVHIGEQTGEFLREQHALAPFDYFVYTAALAYDHPEYLAAQQLGIIRLKRDGLIARLLDATGLKMLACAGTHGKTTTSSLLVWTMQQLGLPVSYSLGTTTNFGASGRYDRKSEYFVYECDEYDRNFLHFTPELSLVSSIDYDHPDTYRTIEEYRQAFTDFIDQSNSAIMWHKDFAALGQPAIASDLTVLDDHIHLEHIHLPGIHTRQNAFLVEQALRRLYPSISYSDIAVAINSFPGVARRMERLAEGLYTDYGHHPTEIAATLQMARELSDHVVLVYQPHQNVRQHRIASEYTRDVFKDADDIYWLPTYLSREDPSLDVLTPEVLTGQLAPRLVHFAQMNDALWQTIDAARHSGKLVLAMGAGDIDGWIRSKITAQN